MLVKSRFLFRKKQKKEGFTLIELLVVIAIIGLLSTMTIVALNSARSKARDTRRIADMRQLVTAINMYYDMYGEYPPLVDIDSTGFDSSHDNVFMPNLKEAGLISSNMKDPWEKLSNFVYYYETPPYPYFSARCPNPDSKYLLIFALESNTPLTGFATICDSQSATTGYRRCICFY